MKIVHKIASVLVWIGALNWGFVGLSGFFAKNWNIVDLILVKFPRVELSLYVIIGVAALYVAITHRESCKDCAVQDSSETIA